MGNGQQIISGVHALARETDTDPMVSMRFRVGQADELLETRGFTHLAEHLALSDFQNVAYPYQGATGQTVTSFHASAKAEWQMDFVNTVVHRLADIANGSLPDDQILHEAKVLSAEEDQRQSGVVGSLASRLFGGRGPGLMNHTELGLRDLQIDMFRAWTAEKFCRANLVIACHNSSPEGLDLEVLALGHRAAPFVPQPILESLPAAFRETGPIGLMAAVERNNGNAVMVATLTKRLTDKLRREMGASYAPQLGYTPISAEHALVIGVADIKPEHATVGVEALLEDIEELATVGPSEEEIEYNRSLFENSIGRVGSAAGMLEGNAEELLFEDELSDQDHIAQQWANLSCEMVRDVSAHLSKNFLLAVPSSAEPAEESIRFIPPDPQDRPVNGTSFHYDSDRGPQSPHGTPTMILGDNGLTLTNALRRISTVERQDVAALMYWDDGVHQLIGRRGNGINLIPNRWARSAHLIDAVKSWMEPHQIKRMGFRSIDPDNWDLPLQVHLSSSGWGNADPRLVYLLDGAGWHGRQLTFGPERPVMQAYVRGGLLLGWLAEHRLLEKWVEDGLAPELAEYRAGELGSPELFKASDGLLATDMVTPMVHNFLVWIHAPEASAANPADAVSHMSAIYQKLAEGLPGPYDLKATAEVQAEFADLMQNLFFVFRRANRGYAKQLEVVLGRPERRMPGFRKKS